MTRTLTPGEVEVATTADLRAAVEHALDRAGCTFPELAAQAKRGTSTPCVPVPLGWQSAICIPGFEQFLASTFARSRGSSRPGCPGS